MLTARPKVAGLQFQLYGRSLHPELFQIHRSKTVQRGEYQARIDITSAGHMVTWQYRNHTLTEVAVAANHPLPEKRRLLKRRLRSRHQDKLKCRGGVSYEVTFELESVNPEIFWSFQQELANSGKQHGMVHQFDSNGRIEMGALSFISATTLDQSLTIQSFHTFPEDHALVKVESVFRLP